jgi:hypothetical protein
MVNIAKNHVCYEEFYEYRRPQHIKQPDAPLGIPLINICKAAHNEEDGHEIADADVLKQVAESTAIFVACRCSAHVLNIAINANCHYNGYKHKEKCGDWILCCSAKQFVCAHDFIVLMMLFIEFIYMFIEFRYAKLKTIFQSTK